MHGVWYGCKGSLPDGTPGFAEILCARPVSVSVSQAHMVRGTVPVYRREGILGEITETEVDYDYFRDRCEKIVADDAREYDPGFYDYIRGLEDHE